ncbi:protein dpy-30 homolog isoform X1 [Mirounga angustirostris]|uniref:protein dpy-30 homolog isoform X1 n=1 Tax=Mirounga angustirostris TaxID=9716 RepID=UPI00313DE440
MEPEQMLEGQTQVAENPHSEYGLTDNVERIVDNEKMNAEKSSKQKVDLQSLPTRAYLDQTVVPILLQGLAVLAKERFYLFFNRERDSEKGNTSGGEREGEKQASRRAGSQMWGSIPGPWDHDPSRRQTLND